LATEKKPKPSRWLRRLNGAGMDPQVGYPADSISLRRLPDGGVRMCLLVSSGQVLASIDWEPTDVRATRDALSQVLRVMGTGDGC
jgi:hypothetical protein